MKSQYEPSGNFFLNSNFVGRYGSAAGRGRDPGCDPDFLCLHVFFMYEFPLVSYSKLPLVVNEHACMWYMDWHPIKGVF